MRLDLPTLAFILSLTCLIQVVALMVQHRVNRTYRGVGWWLAGSALTSLGFILLAGGNTPLLAIPSRIANPMLVAGRFLLLVGVIRFQDRRESKVLLGALYGATLCIYYYFMFGQPSIVGRTVTITAASATCALLTANYLLREARRPLRSGSARFTGAIFLFHGAIMAVICLYTLFAHHISTYQEYSPVQVAVFIIPTLTSTLWTFGFILMVNQRLSAANLEEREKLQRIFNTGPDAALITRLGDGMMVDVNQGFLAITGYAREEVIGRSTLAIDIWTDPANRAAYMEDLTTTGASANREFLFRRKDGETFIGMLSGRIITIDRAPHAITVVRDITGRKQVEEALRQSEATYRSILSASPDDITITDPEGRIELVSPAAIAMFRWVSGEAKGRSLLDFIAPEDWDRARNNIRLLQEGGLHGANEYRGVRQDGTTFDIEVNSGQILGQDGRTSKMVFIVRDITARKQEEVERTELEARNRQLQKSESLGRMAGAVAHLFNNHLQSVLCNLELMAEMPEGTDPAPRLKQARKATERAAEVSRLMLAYLGQTSRDQEPQSLGEICRGCLPVLQGTLPAGVSLEWSVPLPGPAVVANAPEIQQVVTNLVTNAAEAMAGREGQIHVRVREIEGAALPTAGRFPLDWRPGEGTYACLEVEDAGSGITAAAFDQLFDPFFSTKFTGRGLGLPVALGIVQAHHGAVAVESRPGQGSTFRVLLPVHSAGVAAVPEIHGKAPHARPGGTILLVEDDVVLLEGTGALIQQMGFSVLTAADGVEALDVYLRHQDAIVAVITDLTMPRKDGWEVLADLRKLRPELPVILATGYSQGQVLTSDHPDKPQAYLWKPFTRQQLQEALDLSLV